MNLFEWNEEIYKIFVKNQKKILTTVGITEGNVDGERLGQNVGTSDGRKVGESRHHLSPPV